MMRVSLEEFSSLITALHAAMESPGRSLEIPATVATLERTGAEPREIELADIDRQTYQSLEPCIQRLTALLKAHLETAKEIHCKLAEALPGRLALASLDRLAAATLILDRNGTVYHSNAAARALLDDDCSVRIVNSRLRLRDLKLNIALDVALRRATQDPPRSSILPLRSKEQTICELAISPLLADAADLHCGRLALLMIARPQPEADRIVERVRLLYGLTDAEARVMAALALGGTVQQVALRYGVRTSTVRAQVRSIFDKTGVKRQSDLVRLALSGVPLVACLNC